ncbi:HNH endonuclease, partial [Cellulomonas bogoriensis 69B4 = DSM 16987]
AEAGLADDTARARREHARADRCVRMTPAPDAMAWLTAYLPAEDATTVMTALDGLAGRQGPEDDRTTDQRRADALSDVMRTVLDRGHGPDGTPVGLRQHRHPHISITMTPGTALGLTADPAQLDGYGPLPADVARRLAADGAWRGVLTDPVSGSVVARGTKAYRPGPALVALVADRDVTCTFPGCRVPAHRCDIDHVEPYRHPTGRPDPQQAGRSAGQSAGQPAGQPGANDRQTRADNLQALCRHHHRLKTHGGWDVAREPDGTTTWTAPTGHRYARPPEPALGAPPGPAPGPAPPPF